MKADLVQKRKWSQRKANPVERFVVKVEDEEKIHHPKNDGDDHKTIPHTVNIIGGEKLMIAENGVDIGYAHDDSNEKRDGEMEEERLKNYERYKKQNNFSSKRRRRSFSHLDSYRKNTATETSGFNCLTKENDCIDTTFDGMERYTCREPTGKKFPFAPSSSPYKQQQSLDDSLGAHGIDISKKGVFEKHAQIHNNKIVSRDGYDFELVSHSSNNQLDADIPTGFCSTSGSSGGFGFIAEKIGRLLQQKGDEHLNELQNKSVSGHLKSNTFATANIPSFTTLNTSNSERAQMQYNEANKLPDKPENFKTEEKELEFDTSPNRMNHEKSLIYVQSTGNCRERENRDRLERLRQSKRAIEKERLGQSHGQTIVIPRSSLYNKGGEENVEGLKPRRPTKNFQVGSTVTSKQSEKYYFRRKLAFMATMLLISIGLMIVATALFWPTRIL
mmetsp:Transcript_15772/g.36517  ORF Transcript_15772/g.36517 Transcript_15772/m.36517 type:complete len:445 (+) Transcript_15772:226-1560(+)